MEIESKIQNRSPGLTWLNNNKHTTVLYFGEYYITVSGGWGPGLTRKVNASEFYFFVLKLDMKQKGQQ